MTTTLFRYAVGAACAYEAVACFTGWFPTISERVARGGRRGDMLGGVVLGGLALHFLADQP